MIVVRSLVVFVLAVTLVGCGGTTPPAPTGPSVLATSQTAPTSQVTITSTGFEPAALGIKKGATVTWTNRDQVDHWVASDPYPIHTGLGGFVADQATPSGKTWSFTFDRVGEWPYHDHLRPVTYTGTVVVTD